MLELPVGVLGSPSGSEALYYSVRVPYFVMQSRPFSGAFALFINGIVEGDETAGLRQSQSEAVAAGSLAATSRRHPLVPFISEITGGVSLAYRYVKEPADEDAPEQDNTAVGLGVILGDVVLPNLFLGAAISDVENVADDESTSEWRVGASYRPFFGLEEYDLSISVDYVHPLRSAPASFAEGMRIGIANESNLFTEAYGVSVQGRGGVRLVDPDPVVDGNPLEMVASFGVETNWQFFRFGVVFNGIGATDAAAAVLTGEGHGMVLYGGIKVDGEEGRRR